MFKMKKVIEVIGMEPGVCQLDDLGTPAVQFSIVITDEMGGVSGYHSFTPCLALNEIDGDTTGAELLPGRSDRRIFIIQRDLLCEICGRCTNKLCPANENYDNRENVVL